MKKIRVCIVGSLPEPIGGVSTHCYYLSEELQNLGVEIIFYDTTSTSNKSIPEGVEYYNTNEIQVKPKHIFLNFKKYYAILRYLFLLKIFNLKSVLEFIVKTLKLELVFKETHFNIIHSQHASDRSIAPLLLSKMYEIPIVVTTHTSEFSTGKNKLKRRNGKICNFAQSNVFVSKHALKLSRKWGNVNPNSNVVYNGIDDQVFNAHHSTHDIKKQFSITDEIIIVYIGWLIERKGPQVLLEAIKIVSSENIRVFFIGPDHGAEKLLTDLIKKYSLNKKVHLLGKVSDDYLKQILSLCNIFVFPTITNDEGFGLVALEAMASESLVIASRIAAIPEVVKNDVSGYLVEPNNSKELADKIRYVIQNVDFINFGKESRKYASINFSWKKMASETLKIYEGLE